MSGNALLEKYGDFFKKRTREESMCQHAWGKEKTANWEASLLLSRTRHLSGFFKKAK